MTIALILLGLIGTPLQSAPASTTDIVVVAKRQRCRVQLHGTVLSNHELDRYAAEWAANQQVRISVAPGASYKCLAKIMFRLADRGVTHAYFVGTPPPPPPPTP